MASLFCIEIFYFYTLIFIITYDLQFRQHNIYIIISPKNPHTGILSSGILKGKERNGKAEDTVNEVADTVTFTNSEDGIAMH